jgi:hypothetical protein
MICFIILSFRVHFLIFHGGFFCTLLNLLRSYLAIVGRADIHSIKHIQSSGTIPSFLELAASFELMVGHCTYQVLMWHIRGLS